MHSELTPAQAAIIAGVSRPTISRAVKKGELPSRKTNRGALIDPEVLNDWIMNRRRAAQVTTDAPPAVHPAEAENVSLRIENARLEERVAGLEETVRRTDAYSAAQSRELDALKGELALGVLGRAVQAVRRAWRE